MKRLLLAIVTCFIFCLPLTVSATNGANGIHDPSSIIKRNGVYHIWGTGDQVSHLTSTDLINWKVDTTVFAAGTWPSWIATYVPGFAGNFWAPECITINGTYYLYYSCSMGARQSAIGLATSTDLVTWTDQGMVVYSDNVVNYGSIDPAVFADASGNYWMVFGSHLNGIWMAQLNPATGKRLNTTLTNVAGAGTASEHEAAYVTRENGYYYLFYNVGRCCALRNSTYNVRMGRSLNPTGPYVDKNGISLMNGGGTVALYSSGKYIGPGHFGLLKENGRRILTMHYYDGTSNGYPRLDIASLTFSDDGWPKLTRDLIPTGRYKITSKNSGLVWETAGCTGQRNQLLVQNTANTSAVCQQWDLTSTGDGYYRLKNAYAAAGVADQVVDIPFCNTNNKLATYDWLDNDCQKFKIEQHANGSYVFTSAVNADLVIEVPFASTATGVQLGLFTFNGCTCQQWSIDPVAGIPAPEAQPAENVTANAFTAIWNAVPNATGYRLDVSTTPSFSSGPSTIVAGWNFTSNNTATSGVPANIAKTVVPSGVAAPTYAGTAQATGWDNGSGVKYWEAANISTAGYYSLKLFSKQRSAVAGPGNFKLQYKIGAAGIYVDVPGGTVKTADNYVLGTLANVALPTECENQPAVYLRWLMMTNTNVLDTGINSVTAAAPSNIDDIVITGVNNVGNALLTGYNDLPVNGTSQLVTNLSSGTAYYYRVRAVLGTTVSANSNVVSVVTTSGAVDNGIHDPSGIVKEGNKYYMYGTGFTASDNSVVPFTIASSTNLFTWTRGLKPVFPAGIWPAWINTVVPGFAGIFWAPDILFMNGKYYLYYSASTFGSSFSVIGLATSPTLDQDSPNYAWTDQGMVVSSNSSANVNAIDPALFKDTDGRLWMSYGSFSAGLGIIELDTATGLKKTGATTQVVAGGGGSAWEAPYIIKEGAYYYLFANRQYCCALLNSTYYLVVGRSTSPTGPYVDKNGLNLIPVPASSVTVIGTTVLTSSGKYIGPGHFGLLRDNGRNIVSMHYYDGTSNGYPRLDLARLSFTEDGWPLISRDLIPTGRYKITNTTSGLAWETGGCSGQRFQPLVQNTPANAAVCQQWDLTSTGDGYYRLKNAYAATGVAEQVVDIPNCNTDNKLATYDWLNNDCQKFKIDQLANGSYVLSSSVNSSLVIEAPFELTAPQTQLGLTSFNNSTGQQWLITPYVNPPVALPADTITNSSFIAKWTVVPNATSYRLDVSTSPTFASPTTTPVAGWNFEAGTNAANSGITDNIGKPITSNATAVYNATGNGGTTAQATAWNAGNGTKYWEVANISTTGYYGLKISSKQRSNSTAPRHFKLQYKIGVAGIYRDVPGGFVTTADNYSAAALTILPLPADCDNQASVYLRWLMITNTNVGNNSNATAGTVGSTGQSNIDDILITGNAGSFVPGYENLSVNDTSKLVSGLAASTTYYYRLRTVQGSFISVNSNVIPVTTGGALPLHFTKLKAWQKGNNIQVEWEMVTPDGIVRYEVEKSATGQSFRLAGSLPTRAGSSSNVYDWLDVTPFSGNNFYRIKAMYRSGETKYSAVVKVNISNGKSLIAFYPNPVMANEISLQLYNQPSGVYQIRLFNGLGQLLYTTQIKHPSGSATQTVSFGSNIRPGAYQLQISNGNYTTVRRIVFY